MPSASFPTIQSAITAVVSGALPNGTVIEVQPGTYAEAIAFNTTGRSFTVRGVAGPAATIVNAAGRGQPALSVRRATGALRFEGLTFTGGLGGPGTGGGFVIEDASPTFVNCVFRNNASALNGGGGVLTRSNAVFEGCVFENNTAAQFGGGVLVTTGSRPTFLNCVIRNNVSGAASGVGSGGGIHTNDGSPTLRRCTITGNQSRFAGGGIHHQGVFGSPHGPAVLTLEDSEVSDNTTSRATPADNPAEGGGIHIEDNAVALITRSVIRNNAGNTGGGLNAFRAHYKVTSSLIEGNRALDPQNVGGFGGGIAATSNNPTVPLQQASMVILTDTTVRNNTARLAAGIFVTGDQLCAGGPCTAQTATRATLVLTRSLVDNNQATIRGGGILADRTNLTVSESQILRNRVTGATESFGGGLSLVGGSTGTVAGTIIAGNSAQQFGGGLFVDQAAALTVTGSLIYANSVPGSSLGGGGIFVGEQGVSTGEVRDSTLADNQNFQIVELTCAPSGPSAIRYVNNVIPTDLTNQVYRTSCAPAAGGLTSVAAFNALGAAKASGNTSGLPALASFAATPDVALPAVLAWVIPRATLVSLDQGIGSFSGPIGTADVTPSATTTYTLTAVPPVSPLTQTVTGADVPPPPPPQVKPTLVAPAEGTRFPLAAPTVVSIAWTAVPGASAYFFEFTGPNRTFANPNGTAPDPVNGFGGAGGGFTLGETGFSVTLEPSFPPGSYQVRVVGLSPVLQPVGVFSDAITLHLGPPPVPPTARPTLTAPVNGSQLTRGQPAVLAWTEVAEGVDQYFFEFTGPNRTFANPNGTAPDPVNGFGGAGGGFAVSGLGVTVTVPADTPAGTYQVRVIGRSGTGQFLGSFSDAVSVVIP